MPTPTIIRGKVRHGDKRGAKIGYPTANLLVHKPVKDGVYAAEVSINGKQYRSATFIGSAPTFNRKKRLLEAYILDFNGNLYNKWISVRLLKHIRGNQKFTSIAKLLKAIKEDVRDVNKFFKSS